MSQASDRREAREAAAASSTAASEAGLSGGVSPARRVIPEPGYTGLSEGVPAGGSAYVPPAPGYEPVKTTTTTVTEAHGHFFLTDAAGNTLQPSQCHPSPEEAQVRADAESWNGITIVGVVSGTCPRCKKEVESGRSQTERQQASVT